MLSRISLPWVLQLFLITGLTFAAACSVDDLVDKSTDLGHVEDDHSDHADHEDEAPDAEACAHLAEGPAVAVQAVAAVTEPTLADVGAAHTRYDLDLTDVSGGYGGWVRLPVAETGDYVVFLDADVPLKAFAADGTTEIAAEDVEDHSDACDLVAGRYAFEFSVGETMLWFGPATTASVSIVIERAGAHDDHDHDHHDHGE